MGGNRHYLRRYRRARVSSVLFCCKKSRAGQSESGRAGAKKAMEGNAGDLPAQREKGFSEQSAEPADCCELFL